jgi:phosphoadenosine phosphosulfate reductase
MSATETYARASANFAQKLLHSQDLLRQASHEFAGVLTQASSLGAEDMVISHLVNQLGLDLDIFVLETGRLHVQTLELLERFRTNSRAPVRVYRPDPQRVAEFVLREGPDAMYKSIALRKECCHIRKMEPLETALSGKKAWITGLRREQSGTRADVPEIDRSERRVKFNPLADWTWGDVWHCISTEGIDYNPLHDQFYPSIGCEPCTRAISLGEDFRAGRWWWEGELDVSSAKECGLHVKAGPVALPLSSSIRVTS